MSVPDVPPTWPPNAPLSTPPQRPQGLGGCLAVLLVIFGIVLLLPGVCSLILMVAFKGDGAGALGLLWLVTFGVAALGIMLIRYAIKNR